MIFVTSDLHGKFDCLKKLLDAARFSENEDNWLYIIGDVIDRNGEGGVDILKWLLLQPNVQLILGNHEDMLLSNRWIFEQVDEDSISTLSPSEISRLTAWQSNGAECTIEALRRESPDMRVDILEYLDDCPMLESVSVGGRNYLLAHGGLGDFRRDKPLYEYTSREILWERPAITDPYAPDLFTLIVGHTPTVFYSPEYKNRMLKTSGFWNIDTGAARSEGRPMLLCLDTLTEYYIEDDGSVLRVDNC